MIVRDDDRGGADVEPTAQDLADQERRLVDRTGKDLFVDEMVLGAEIEDAQFFVAGMALSAAQIGDHCGLVPDQRAILDILSQHMADDAVHAIEQRGGFDILGGGGDRFAIGGQDRAERSVAV